METSTVEQYEALKKHLSKTRHEREITPARHKEEMQMLVTELNVASRAAISQRANGIKPFEEDRTKVVEAARDLARIRHTQARTRYEAALADAKNVMGAEHQEIERELSDITGEARAKFQRKANKVFNDYQSALLGHQQNRENQILSLERRHLKELKALDDSVSELETGLRQVAKEGSKERPGSTTENVAT